MLNLISNDIKTIISNKKMSFHKAEDRPAEHHKDDEKFLKDENDKAIKDEIAVLKTLISTHVNYDEMNVVMTDIKESLELYINETPRDNNRSELDDLYQKMEIMKSQMEVLHEAINNIPKMEILDAPGGGTGAGRTRDIIVLPQTTKIPKLVIKRSLKV